METERKGNRDKKREAEKIRKKRGTERKRDREGV